MLCITSYRVTRLLQRLRATSQSFLSCTDNFTQKSWFIYNTLMGFSRFKFCLCLFSDVAHPPDRAIRPGLQTELLFTRLFLLSFFPLPAHSLQVMENKLPGRSFQARWLYCGQGVVLELQSAFVPHIPCWAFLSLSC